MNNSELIFFIEISLSNFLPINVKYYFFKKKLKVISSKSLEHFKLDCNLISIDAGLEHLKLDCNLD